MVQSLARDDVGIIYDILSEDRRGNGKVLVKILKIFPGLIKMTSTDHPSATPPGPILFPGHAPTITLTFVPTKSFFLGEDFFNLPARIALPVQCLLVGPR